MAYHDDLLSQSLQLVHTSPPTQASLRRAVSTAYYAVFHLPIAEATSNWSNASLRTALGRAFDHGTMKTASNRTVQATASPSTGEDPAILAILRNVAQTFSQLQEGPHFADYDLTTDLDPTDALNQVKSAERVFLTWPGIRGTLIAQRYLVSLVVKHR